MHFPIGHRHRFVSSPNTSSIMSSVLQGERGDRFAHVPHLAENSGKVLVDNLFLTVVIEALANILLRRACARHSISLPTLDRRDRIFIARSRRANHWRVVIEDPRIATSANLALMLGRQFDRG
jgi:hypothetical protein